MQAPARSGGAMVTFEPVAWMGLVTQTPYLANQPEYCKTSRNTVKAGELWRRLG